MGKFHITKKELITNCIAVIVIVAIAYVSEYTISANGLYQKLLWVCLSAIGVCYIFIYGKIDKYSMFLLKSAVPYICAAIYTVIINLFTSDVLGTSIQSCTTAVFIITDMFMTYYLVRRFNEKSIFVFYYGIVLSYIITVVVAISRLGFWETIYEFAKDTPLYLEKHDVGVATIPIILCFIFLLATKHIYIKEKLKSKIAVLIIVTLLCGKRSAYMGLVVGILIIAILCFFDKKTSYGNVVANIICFFTFVFCCSYIILIHSGFMAELLGETAFKDRLYVWTWFDNQYWLTPSYMGKGFQFVHKYMQAGRGSWMVNTFDYLHNSILQIYIELGFCGFMLWFGFFLFYMSRYIKRNFCLLTQRMYIILICSTIMIYTVDNVLTYPLYIVSMYTSLCAFNKILEKNNKKENTYENSICSTTL